jgi:hypothetical protein
MISSILSTVSSTMSATTMGAPSTISTAPVLRTYATIGVSDLSIVSLICLIALLSASDLLSSTIHWNKRLSTMLNISIVPMVLTFFLIVSYTVIEIVTR